MTRKEAIEAIKCNWPDSRYTILREALDMAVKALDAVPVVRCENCVLHGNCTTEDAFMFAEIEHPFCCAGKRKEGAD